MVARRLVGRFCVQILLPFFGGLVIALYIFTRRYQSTIAPNEAFSHIHNNNKEAWTELQFAETTAEQTTLVIEKEQDEGAGESGGFFPTETVDEGDEMMSYETRAPDVPIKSALDLSKSQKGQWSCRHRWTKWLNQNSFKPTTAFSNVLDRYNRLHDKLLRELPIEEAFQISLTSPRNTVRYIVWRPVGQDLAGRLLSLVSAFLVALLTDRVLLVNFPNVRYLLCEPFLRSSWIIPQRLLPLLNRFMKIELASDLRRPVRIARLKLQTDYRNDDSLYLTCNGNLKASLTHIQILLMESPIGFVELLAKNPSHRDRLQEWFGNGIDASLAIYPALLHHLLHPANDMWFRLIDSYHRHYTNNPDRPSRMALHHAFSSISRHQLTCAIHQIPREKSKRNILVHYSPPSRSLVKFISEILSEFSARVITSENDHIKEGELGDWRRLFTDVWMASWSPTFIITQPNQAALLSHYYRNRETLMFSNNMSYVLDNRVGEDVQTCHFERISYFYLPSIPESSYDCIAFRQARRERRQTKEYTSPGAIILTKDPNQ